MDWNVDWKNGIYCMDWNVDWKNGIYCMDWNMDWNNGIYCMNDKILASYLLTCSYKSPKLAAILVPRGCRFWAHFLLFS